MGIGMIIILGLIVGEIVALAKIGKQNKRIQELEDETGITRKKSL